MSKFLFSGQFAANSRAVFYALIAAVMFALSCIGEYDFNNPLDSDNGGRPAYTISFNANGGSVSTTSGRTSERDGRLSSLPAPVRSGHAFDGWFTAMTGGTRVTVNYVFSGNTTIYAQWIVNTCTQWSSWSVKAATCDAAGDSTRTCQAGVDSTETRVIARLTGAQCVASCTQWSGWTVKAATCDAAGDSTRTCQAGVDSTEVRVIAIDVNNHDWNDWAITSPTCTNKGDSTRICKRNGDHKEIRVIDALGHDWGNWSLRNSPSCTAPGDSIRVCSRGDFTDVRVIAQLTGLQCVTYGSFTDERPGANNQSYRTVVIGGKTWFAENLNYAGSGGSVGVCYNNADSNCTKYGRLYTWAEAMDISSSYNNSSTYGNANSGNHQGVCPVGWRLPNDSDWNDLVTAVGSPAGTKLKSQTGWNTGSGYIPGTNESGFSALPGGGRRTDGSFLNVGVWGYWWSATEIDAGNARRRVMYWYIDYVNESWNYKSNGYSGSLFKGLKRDMLGGAKHNAPPIAKCNGAMGVCFDFDFVF